MHYRIPYILGHGETINNVSAVPSYTAVCSKTSVQDAIGQGHSLHSLAQYMQETIISYVLIGQF